MHELDYLAAVKAAERGQVAARFGFGPGDNPPFAGMHEAATRVCGATVGAAEAIRSGQSLTPSPGRRAAPRHARPGQRLLRLQRPRGGDRLAARPGVERIAYVDVDVHHGDGVEAIFADEPKG